ncbi:MAG: uroporphyrinogen decarboxylase [Alphaproteobacteria bacterium]|nr:uroporphyrinogen decarboxylase [Alphaproteobacteria bacterium]
MTQKLLIAALNGELTERIPFWFMRQAGRYLPEYREVRATTSGFLDLCFTPEKAAEVTLQPLRRFHMDAAILFSDILVIPYALGVDVKFVEQEGPRVGITTSLQAIEALKLSVVRQALEPVAQTVRLVKKKLPEGAALIGFAGAPWTVACYMLQGKSGKDFEAARLFALTHPARMEQLIDTLVMATFDYLCLQIEAGAEAVQIFDSWAGLLPPAEFARWVTAPTAKLVEMLRKKHPTIPIIGFAKGAGSNLAEYAKQTGVQAIGADHLMPISAAITARATPKQAVQGNLDPLLIATDKDAALAATEVILTQLKTTPAVFNLGHGFIPATPIEHVAAVAEKVRAWRR